MSSTRPDSRVFASYPMPAKIDLINERPRREGEVERQLEDKISPMGNSDLVPKITIGEQGYLSTDARNANKSAFGQENWSSGCGHLGQFDVGVYQDRPGSGASEVKETRIIINQRSSPIMTNNMNYDQQQHQNQLQQQQQQQQPSFTHQQSDFSTQQQAENNRKITTTTTTTTTTTNQQQQQQRRLPSMNMTLNKTISNNALLLANELAEKEAKLMKEITIMHQRPYSPYQTPGKIDLTSEQRTAQQQYQNAPQQSLSRPNSSASNKSNAGLDLIEKEAKLMKEIEELESKPYNPQTLVVEREQWYEYPENRPQDRHLTESKRRVREFCSIRPGSCQDKHIHEENLRPKQNQSLSASPGSIHTIIIRSPEREIDNKSPLPFAFDNFSTKGIRGNIASVGAVEPERPRPPIYPIVKRSPSPNVARG